MLALPVSRTLDLDDDDGERAIKRRRDY